jgi:SNF2 family DNA or RNA helicase
MNLHLIVASMIRCDDFFLLYRHTKSQLFNGVPLLSLPKITERRIWIQFPDEQRSAYNRLAAKANELFQRFDHVGRACPRLLEVLALLLPVRRACSGERFDLAQMQLNLEIADQQLMVMGYSQADINAGQHHLLAAPIAYNAEDIECVICLEELEDPLQTPCRHVFCRACIASIAERLKACPICRQPIDVASLSAPPARQAAVPSVAPVAAEIVHFTAKVDALMHELQQLRRTHPQEKALVFSQFSATLAMVSNRMSARGMPWRSLSGSMSADQRQRQVELFNNDPPGSVFLLPLRSSAVGLTLTSATHVFMLDPCLNPALEQQAKNRVYRMGQTKDVYFYRLLMKHSVESNMDLLMRNRESEFSSASTDALKKAAYTVDELRVCSFLWDGL